jgi:hypothetical protein
MVPKVVRVLSVLALLALLMIPAATATAGSGFFTEFSGSDNCTIVTPPTVSIRGGMMHIVGEVEECTDDISLPSVSGTEYVVANIIADLSTGTAHVWGTSHIVNAGGEWVGEWTGSMGTDGVLHIRMSSHGVGGYQGMHAWEDLVNYDPTHGAPNYVTGRVLDPGR